MDQTKVMIVEEQPLFRAGVAHELAKSGMEVTECDPKSEVLGAIEAAMPDVVLLGSDLDSGNGLDLGRKIVRVFPNIRVIILSPDPNDEELFNVIRTAAVACLKKNSTPGELLDVIQRARRGEYPINDSLYRPTVARQVLNEFQSLSSMGPQAEDVVAPLTSRECQILTFVAGGNTNRQIALTLKISEQTIKNHVSAILRKLNANDRAHAAVLALRRGWIQVEMKAPGR